MKKYHVVVLCFILIVTMGEKNTVLDSEKTLVRYVNPLIGTAPSNTTSASAQGNGTENAGQVIPEVTMPFGMTNWTPQTNNAETKCLAPYYYDDTLISGFRGSHWLSGSCTQDYGSFTLMPMTGRLVCSPEERSCRYFHQDEMATPYYYKVLIRKYNIESEMTATQRCGLLRFTFHNADTGFVVLEPNSDFGEGYVQVIPDKQEIVGYNPVHRIYQGWGQKAGFSGYFVAKFDARFRSCGVYQGSKTYEGKLEASNDRQLGAFVAVAVREKNAVVARIGTSFTSIAEAEKNLDEETNGLDFDSVKQQLKKTWNKMLSVIQVEGGSEAAKTCFYTALYHSFLLPRTYNDCDGSYPSFGGGDSICNSGKNNYYCDFSIWDTYRALHPLFNLLLPKYSADMVASLMSKADQGGWLPIFPCWNSYTSEMIGDHGISVVADAYVKGVVTLTDREYDLLKKNATQTPEDYKDYINGKGVRALKSYMRYGYIPLEDSVKESFHPGEQVSRTLEYAYDDFALSQIAEKMGKTQDYQYFLDRSKNYRNVYDETVTCVRGRFADGTFTKDFEKTRRMHYITEGTPWQYTWYVPQDVPGLIAQMGGAEKFNRNLDEFFAGGQYWHGNEPDQQVPFLYTYSGEPWKTQKLVRQILSDEYNATPGGLSGNDDAGQISAWYVFASLGLYPVCPSTQEYALTAPAFQKITLNLPNSKQLVIKADGISDNETYVRGVNFNGREIKNFQIRHSDLIEGGVLDFTMEKSPSMN